MDAEAFEKWFQEQLLSNLPCGSVIVLDNAPYHSRQLLKVPCSSTKKGDILEFMKIKIIEVPSPCPTKSVLLNIIKNLNFEKQYVVDELAKKFGHTVLRLPPYYCIFNPIEII